MESINEFNNEIEILKKENEYLKGIAFYDGLTKCYTRNWYYANLTNDSDVYITLADINFLRTINFVLGHNAGDQLILDCVNVFKKYGDVVRLGGDEFVILSYNEKDFKELMSLTNNKFSLGGYYKPKSMKVSKAIEEADKLLYENKRYIKNGGTDMPVIVSK